MMPDDYWAKRKSAEDQWIKDNLADDAKFQRWMQGKFDKALTEIQRDIDSEYQKYGGGDNLTMKQAIRRVSAEDVKGYQDKAAEIVAEAQRLRKEKGAPLTKSDFTDEVNNQLRLYNATMRINRLEMLKSKIGLELTQANMNVDAELKSRLMDGYQDEIKRQAGILGESIPMTSVSSAIGYTNASIDGATFSQRIWANQAALKGQLDDLITRAVIRGENPRKIAPWLKDQIKQTVDNRRYVTERIARTEMARVQDDAQTESFKRYGYDYCKWVAEPSACTICREIASENDGVYKVSEAPAIPVHANCRCSKAAWYGDSKQRDSFTASGDGKQYSVSSRDDFINKMQGLGFDQVQARGLNVDNGSKIYDTIGKFYDEFPQMRGYIRALGTIDDPQNPAVASVTFNNAAYRKGNLVPTLKINTASLKNFDQILTDAVKNNWWTSKSDYTGVINHEIAHLINFKRNFARARVDVEHFDPTDPVQSSLVRGAINTANGFTIDHEVMLEAFQRANIPLTEENIRKYVSNYGASNYAEAYAEAMSNEDPNNPITPIVKEITRRELDKLGPTTKEFKGL